MMIPHSFKRIVPLVLALLVLLTIPLSVSAAEFDISKTGTIKIQLRDVYFPDRPIGGTVVLHKVGDAKVENSNLTFALTTASMSMTKLWNTLFWVTVSMQLPSVCSVLPSSAAMAARWLCAGMTVAFPR